MRETGEGLGPWPMTTPYKANITNKPVTQGACFPEREGFYDFFFKIKGHHCQVQTQYPPPPRSNCNFYLARYIQQLLVTEVR